METNIRGNGKMVKSVDKVYMNFPHLMYMRVIGLMEKGKEKVYINGTTVKCIMEIGKMTKCMDSVSSPDRMDLPSKENFLMIWLLNLEKKKKYI